MHRIFLFLALIITSFASVAQSEVKDQVVNALGSGDAAALGRTLVSNVDLTVLNTSEYYSRAQAEQVLKKFLDDQMPQGFIIEHEGTSKMGDSYYIGRLKTGKGEYRVTFFLKKSGDVFQVKQLRIDNGNKTR